MAVHYRTQGFFLKKEDLREADQVFIVYTKDFGKLKISARAIRKIKSKLRAGAGLFYLSEIEFIQGKTHKTLTDAITIEKFKNIRNSPGKLEIISQIAELADNLIGGQEKDEKVWDLLNEVFEKLNEGTKFLARNLVPSFQELLYCYFLWNLLSILGYQIDLYRCAVCLKKLIPGKNYFDPEQGIVCSKCRKEGDEISTDVIKILRLFLEKNWKILGKLKITESCQKELRVVSEKYLAYYQKTE